MNIDRAKGRLARDDCIAGDRDPPRSNATLWHTGGATSEHRLKYHALSED